MGWAVHLEKDNGELCKARHSLPMGSIQDAKFHKSDLNPCDGVVTYNYSKIYTEVGCYLPDYLHNRKAKDTEFVLEMLVGVLGVDQSTDYWAKTWGNAGYICAALLIWAYQNPEGIWKVYK